MIGTAGFPAADANINQRHHFTLARRYRLLAP